MATVGEILENKGRAVQTTWPGATVFQAVEQMCLHHVGSLLVRRDDTPVGMITERDVMTRVILARRDPASTLVDDVMSREVVCVEVHTKTGEAMAIMTERRCRHLPVVLDGRVVGLVSIGDLVRWVSLEHEFEIRMLTDYVRGAYG